MSAHRSSCKMQANGKPSLPTNQNNSEKIMSGLARIGSTPGGGGIKLNSGGDDLSNVDVDTDQEVTKLVTTPDIQCYEDMEGPDTPSNGGTSSKASSPPPPPSMHSALSVAPPPHPQSNHSHQISNSLHNHSQHNHSAVAAQAAAAAAAIQGKDFLKHCFYVK